MTALRDHDEFLGPSHPGEVNGPRQWANPGLFHPPEAKRF